MTRSRRLDHQSKLLVNITSHSHRSNYLYHPHSSTSRYVLDFANFNNMDFGDSGELYTIRNQFYTWQHHKVIDYSVEQFTDVNQLKVLEYKVRSTIAIGKDASKLIEDGKTKFPGNEELFLLLSAWNDLHSFGTDDSTYFEDIKSPKFELQAILTSLYLVKFFKNIDQGIELLVSYIDNLNVLQKNELESYLVLIQLYLVKGNFNQANKIFNNFKSFPEILKDDVIYHVIESWILALKGETDNINNSFYFYDELLANDFDNELDRFKILNVLFVLSLKLNHLPEAQEFQNQLAELGIKNDDFLANQIVMNYLSGKQSPELIEKLTELNPDHQYLVDRKDKNDKFDQIVEKYKVDV